MWRLTTKYLDLDEEHNAMYELNAVMRMTTTVWCVLVVCRIYSEQRAIRVKRVVDRKRL